MPRVANALPTRRTAGLGGVKHIHLDIRLRGLVLLSLNTVPQYHYGSKSRTNGKRFLSRISRAHGWALGSGTAGARPKGCISAPIRFRRTIAAFLAPHGTFSLVACARKPLHSPCHMRDRCATVVLLQGGKRWRIWLDVAVVAALAPKRSKHVCSVRSGHSITRWFARQVHGDLGSFWCREGRTSHPGYVCARHLPGAELQKFIVHAN